MDNPIDDLTDEMAKMVARYLVWLAPQGQIRLRIRILNHLIKRIAYFVNQL